VPPRRRITIIIVSVSARVLQTHLTQPRIDRPTDLQSEISSINSISCISRRLILDQRSLENWASQTGKVCAAAVVAGALNSVSAGAAAVTVEDVLLEFQSAWQAQIEAVKADALATGGNLSERGRESLESLLSSLMRGDAGAGEGDGDHQLRADMLELSSEPVVHEKLALLARLTASYRKVHMLLACPSGTDSGMEE
jgi:hypothetical protein